MTTQTDDLRPDDPPFLFVMLLAARKAKDQMLESLVSGWLEEVGIRVHFASELPRVSTSRRKAVAVA